MSTGIRSFVLVIVDDLDNEIDRYPLEYVDTPKNLGFEMQFTTIESRLTTLFTSVREKKLPTTLNINFLPPEAYQKANRFKNFVQRYMNRRMVLEYNDTVQIKSWEGKVQKFGQEELTEWGGLVCPISFLPATPKYIKKDNTILIQFSPEGKRYPFKYPYYYGYSLIRNNVIENTYFDEIPLRVTLHGPMYSPRVALSEVREDGSREIYSAVQFDGLTINEGEHVIIDAIQSKVLLYRDGKYTSAYDYVDKSTDLDVFLHAKGDVVSEVTVNLTPEDTGYLTASYRQYTL